VAINGPRSTEAVQKRFLDVSRRDVGARELRVARPARAA
jgi:hypothetical protein